RPAHCRSSSTGKWPVRLASAAHKSRKSAPKRESTPCCRSSQSRRNADLICLQAFVAGLIASTRSARKTPTLNRVDHARFETEAGAAMRARLRIRIASDGLLEFFGDAESHFLARLDLDRFAGRGVASHASRA